MAFNSHIATSTIILKIRELEAQRRAWEDEGARLGLAQLLDNDKIVSTALGDIRLECFRAAARIREQIEALTAELDAIEAGPSFFRPHRK